MHEEGMANGGTGMTIRKELGVVSLCWIAVVAGSLALTAGRWYPEVVALFALPAALCTTILLFRPSYTPAYRAGGTFGIGALAMHACSLLGGLVHSNNPDVTWLFLIEFALAVLTSLVWTKWWLTSVKDWHYTHVIIEDHDRAAG